MEVCEFLTRHGLSATFADANIELSRPDLELDEIAGLLKPCSFSFDLNDPRNELIR
jgi:hypothetical protein